MTKDKALDYVASLLAADCKKFQDMARDHPNLADNARDLAVKSEEAAQALGIARTFYAKCRLHGVKLD